MVLNIFWADKAISDRETIFESNDKVSGLSYAKAEDQKIKRAVSTIKRNNKIGRNDLDERGYVYILPHRYKILYRLSDEFIFIERVFY
ncbi:type II toxin-antitoxin system RelE/ParE family toxin [Escherichia marmotae]|uniref:type II toxin-antitoxin system RelE/ParE family toxin n=1 Tax=Escherichia marmotae TaxID=1499973 RepID=UPI003D96EE77